MTPRAYLIAALALALLVFAGWTGTKIERAPWLLKESAWSRDRTTLESQIAALRLAALASEQAARAREQAMNLQITEAKTNAEKREKTLRLAADAAESAARGLRGDITAALNRLSGSAAAADHRALDAAGHALGECADQYRALAAEADRIESDRTTLTEAWPR